MGLTQRHEVRVPHALLLALTAVAVITQGYHPFAEDGGVYAAGIKHLLDPSLYPHYPEFVTEHLRFSVFAPAMALLTRALHVELPWTLLLAYLTSTWLLLYATWRIAAQCLTDSWGRAGAVALMAGWCGLPVAGTSLMLMDPYVTARSIAVPLTLLAAAAVTDFSKTRNGRSLVECLVWTVLAGLLHPLVAVYGFGFVVLLLCSQARQEWTQRWGCALMGVIAVLLAAVVQLASAREGAAEHAVALTRYYWFPLRWQDYELIGLAAPLLVIAALVGFALRGRTEWTLGNAAVWLGVISSTVAFLFARSELASHAVARLQPLRCYMTVYAVMLTLLGGWVTQRWLRGRWLLAMALLAVAASGLFFGQRQYYPASVHLEMPWRTPRNPWVQAFNWVRANTPVDALFALDANYITTDGEDAQCFRAIAERSALPDYSKDGGETSITPSLTAAWVAGSEAQRGLSVLSAAERKQRLLPLGVSWLVLKQGATTELACPYSNETVKVCRLN